ncbi:MAG: hypothetical protein DCC74_09530 [Proteobacteria bacterium]|nr:MAG: hypothetical protein DCC74_09530 [Pseudomonadota bacterium]
MSSVAPSTPSVATPASRPAPTPASPASGEDFAALLDSAPTAEPAAAPAEPPRSSADPTRNETGKGKPAKAESTGKARNTGDKTGSTTAKDAAEGTAGDSPAGTGTTSAAATVAAMVAPVTPAAPVAPATTETTAPAGTAEQLALTAIGGTATPTATPATPGDATVAAATEAAPAATAAPAETAPTPAQTATGLVAGNTIAAHLPAIGATRLAGGKTSAIPGLSPGAETAPNIATEAGDAAEPADAQADAGSAVKADAKRGRDAKADGDAGADKTHHAKAEPGPESGRAGKAEGTAGNFHPAGEATSPTATAAPDSVAQPSGTSPVLPQTHLATAATITPQVTVMPPAVAVPPGGLALAIASQARAGHSRFDIQLEPAELGRIDVRLSIDRHGTVTSHVVVEKAETLDLLRRDAPHLQRALDDAGLKTGSGGLQFSLRDQTPQNRDDGDTGARPRIVIADDVVAAETAGRNYGRPLQASSGLDIRV